MQPVYIATAPQREVNSTNCHIGLDRMRYFDETECMKVEMVAIEIITIDSSHSLTGGEEPKYEVFTTVTQYRVESGEI